MNKLEFSLLVDCFVWIFETIRGYGFLLGFPPFLNFKFGKLWKSQVQENQRWGVKSASRGDCE